MPEWLQMAGRARPGLNFPKMAAGQAGLYKWAHAYL